MTVKGKNCRQWWLTLHLYLGLSLGLLLSVVGVSGSLLVFYLDLDEILNPELVITNPDLPRLSYQDIFNNIKKAEPNRLNSWRLEIPESPHRMLTARYYKPSETAQKDFAPLLLSINPYTGEIVKNRFWGQTVMTWIYDLHYTLLLGNTGKIMMAVIGVFLLMSLISGLYLWWPPLKKIVSAVTIKTNASKERLTYDLHKTAGIYSFLVMLVITLSGIALEIPEYVNPIIGYFSPLQKAVSIKSEKAASSVSAISVDRAVMIAQAYFPEAKLTWIETPQDPQGSYRINFYQEGEPSRRFPKTNIWVDQYTGKVLKISDPFKDSAGGTLIRWLHPLHSGEAFGLSGRLLVLIAGLGCPLLFVTGVIRWLQKRNGRKRVMRRTMAVLCSAER